VHERLSLKRMIETLERQFLLNTGLLVLQHCKNASLTLRCPLLGQMIGPLVSLVLKNVSLIHPLLAMIELFHMMQFVLTLAIALLGLLNLFGLLFVQMIDRGDLGHHPETDTRDQ
jgi:hypothetical protein